MTRYELFLQAVRLCRDASYCESEGDLPDLAVRMIELWRAYEVAEPITYVLSSWCGFAGPDTEEFTAMGLDAARTRARDRWNEVNDTECGMQLSVNIPIPTEVWCAETKAKHEAVFAATVKAHEVTPTPSVAVASAATTTTTKPKLKSVWLFQDSPVWDLRAHFWSRCPDSRDVWWADADSPGEPVPGPWKLPDFDKARTKFLEPDFEGAIAAVGGAAHDLHIESEESVAQGILFRFDSQTGAGMVWGLFASAKELRREDAST